eukprot:COSAG02_NODE_15977_length_1123_cov_1.572266_1_plen_95_part_10
MAKRRTVGDGAAGDGGAALGKHTVVAPHCSATTVVLPCVHTVVAPTATGEPRGLGERVSSWQSVQHHCGSVSLCVWWMDGWVSACLYVYMCGVWG